MHRTALRKITVLFVICTYLLTADLIAQSRTAEELVVTRCWSYELGETPASILALDGARVFIGGSGARIEAISLDGGKVWASDLGGDIASNILPLESGVFVATATTPSDPTKTGDSMMRALSKETGITNWTLKLPGSGRHFLHAFNGSIIIVSNKGVVQSVDAKTGAVKWKREISQGFVASPVFNAAQVLVAGTGKQIFSVSMASGEIDSMRKLAFGLTALNEIGGGGALIGGDARGNVTALASGTEKVNWRFKTGGEISGITAMGENLLVTSHDNFVYFIAGRDGDVLWRKRLAGRVSHTSGILNKFAVITSFEEHGASIIDLMSGKVAGQIVLGSEESVVFEPVSTDGLVFLLTNQAVHAYSLNGCASKSAL